MEIMETLIHEKPDWKQYFLGLAYVVSARSPDKQTKHGAVITDKQNFILGVGYNGPLSGIDDTKIPKTRPDKYIYFAHAESNALDNARMLPKFINGGGTIFITGKPCNNCLQRCIRCGINHFVIGNRTSEMLKSPENERIYQFLLDETRVTVENLELDPKWIIRAVTRPETELPGENTELFNNKL